MHHVHIPVFVRTSLGAGGRVTIVKQDFLCTFFVHKRSFSFVQQVDSCLAARDAHSREKQKVAYATRARRENLASEIH